MAYSDSSVMFSRPCAAECVQRLLPHCDGGEPAETPIVAAIRVAIDAAIATIADAAIFSSQRSTRFQHGNSNVSSADVRVTTS